MNIHAIEINDDLINYDLILDNVIQGVIIIFKADHH